MKGYTVALIVAATGILCVWYAGYITSERAAYFASILEAAGAREEVFVGGEAYKVDGGSVRAHGGAAAGAEASQALRLAYQKVLARYAPLFALPGTKPEEIEHLAEALRGLQSRFAERQQTPEARRAIEALYPVAYLDALAKAERARTAYLAHADERRMAEYVAAEYAAASAYTADLARFRQAFISMVPEGVPAYATDTEIITRDGILSALDRLSTFGANLMDRLEQRRSCASGVRSSCEPDAPSVALPEPTEQEPLSGSTLRQAQLSRELRTRAGFYVEPGPLVRLSESACVARSESAGFYFALEHLPYFDTTYRFPIYVGDTRFIRSALYADKPFIDHFAAAGVPLVPSSQVTHYSCASLYRDFGAVEAARAIRQFASSTALSAFAPEEGILRTLESRLGSDSVFTEADAIRYLREGLRLAAEGVLPDVVGEEVRSLALQFERRSLGLYPATSNLVYFEEENLRLSDEGIRIEFDAGNLFFVRSGFASFFLAGLPPDRGNEKMFPRNTLSSGEKPYVYYSELLRSPSSAAEALRDFTFFYKVYHP